MIFLSWRQAYFIAVIQNEKHIFCSHVWHLFLQSATRFQTGKNGKYAIYEASIFGDDKIVEAVVKLAIGE